MGTPVADIIQLINKNIKQFEPLGLKSEHLHAYSVDHEDNNKTDAIVVVSEIPRRGSVYGNGVPILDRRRVQLTFYYPRFYAKDMEKLEQALRLFLLQYNYYEYSNAGHTISPDTQNITNTLKFNFNKEII